MTKGCEDPLSSLQALPAWPQSRGVMKEMRGKKEQKKERSKRKQDLCFLGFSENLRLATNNAPFSTGNWKPTISQQDWECPKTPYEGRSHLNLFSSSPEGG